MRSHRAAPSAVLLFSGGIDSTLVALHLAETGYSVHALSVRHEHRPAAEIRAAKRLARRLPLTSWHEVTIRGIAFGPPPGTPMRRASLEGVIAHRNILFWSLAANRARTVGATAIAAGHTREDARSYTDAAPPFFRNLAPLLGRSGVRGIDEIEMLLPLQDLPARHWRGIARGHPEIFDATWSCWRDGDEPCEACFACKQRSRFLGGGS